MIVRCCKECPFFKVSMIAILARGPNAGICFYDPVGDRLRPEFDITSSTDPIGTISKWLLINQKDLVPPSECPLRIKEVVVSLAPTEN